ncbi:MAG: alpha/beta hydrolase family protein, partial [Microthrixaceae bacterium]
GEFPLVIYSHGNGGLRYVSSFMTEHLASHGFVVLAPDHTGNTALDTFLGTDDETEQVALDRPLDVSAVIDAVESGGTGLEEIAAVTDTDDVAVTGHSFGGYTALVLAGGASGQPADERVDAIVGLAPASSRITDDTLTAVDVPTLLVSGTLDETTPVDDDTVRPAEQVTGRPLVRADIDGAGHQSFTDICSYLEIAQTRTDLPPALVEAIEDYAVEGCAPELIDFAEAHRVTNRLATAFLLDALYDDQGYTALLSEPADEDQPLAVLDYAA